MIFVISGEGPSDIGACENGQDECSGTDFKPGPMARIIEKLVESCAGFSLPNDAVEFVSEARRLAASKALPISYTMGKKRDYEGGYFFKEARALASIANQKALAHNCPVAAVLFRDADGTRSTEDKMYEIKRTSIEDGFRAADFELGVPMVPKPKSEAWLLCALKTNPYQNCAGLEESLSGNDNAPNSAKCQLQERLGVKQKTTHDLADLVSEGTISSSQINMPSFNHFRNHLEDVTNRMLGRPIQAHAH